MQPAPDLEPAAAVARLVERDDEVAALEAVLQAAHAGRGAMVVVAGPGGIGKSRLAAHAREAARAGGARVLSARCSELERSFPFGAVRQLLEPLLRAPERGELFQGAAALAAPLLEGSAPRTGDDATLFSTLHGLYWLVASLADRAPVLLAVDDAHWADEASLRFMDFLSHRVGDIPVVLLVATRPADDPSADAAVGTLLSDSEALQLRPAPLTTAGVTALLAAGAEPPDPAFVAACREVTGGNPFLLRELVGAVAAEGLAPRQEGADRVRTLGPAGVATVISGRLQRLAPDAAALVRALTILGDGVEPLVAGAFAALPEAQVLEAARLLEAAGIADAVDGLRFVHPIVRQSVYQQLTSIERREGHAAAARFLAARGAPADAIAAHLLHAPPRGDAEAVEALRAAAALATALGDPLAAVEHLRRAVAEPPAPEELPVVLFALGQAAAGAGLTEAPAHLEACLAARPPDAIRVEAAEVLAELRQYSGHPDMAVDVLEEAIAALGEETPEGRRLTRALVVGPAFIGITARRRAAARLAALRDPGGPARDQSEVTALAALAGTAIMDANDGAAAADLGLRALAGPPPVAPDAGVRAAAVVTALSLTMAEEHRAADGLLSAMLEQARGAGARPLVASVLSLRALARLRRGEVARAEADALAALELLPEAHGAEMMAHAGTAAAVLAGIERERPRSVLEDVLEQTRYRRDPDILPYSQILLARGELALAHGDAEDALRWFEACDRPGPGWARDTPSMVWWRSGAARALHALGRGEEARLLAGEELALSRASGLEGSTGRAQRVAALVGPPAEQVAGLGAAVATLERVEAPLDTARALADLGAALRRAGDRTGARDALLRAHELAEPVGATRTARVARQELRDLGARPRAAADQGLAALTPAERRVADLAAAGRTNREIAQGLFLSEKTVETHLARVFRKLGARSRKQLPALVGA